jgi:hypothetical protein
MRKATCDNMNCALYRQLAAARMSEIERQQAEDAIRVAHTIVDALMWVKESIASLGARLPRLSFKRQDEAHRF